MPQYSGGVLLRFPSRLRLVNPANLDTLNANPSGTIWNQSLPEEESLFDKRSLLETHLASRWRLDRGSDMYLFSLILWIARRRILHCSSSTIDSFAGHATGPPGGRLRQGFQLR